MTALQRKAGNQAVTAAFQRRLSDSTASFPAPVALSGDVTGERFLFKQGTSIFLTEGDEMRLRSFGAHLAATGDVISIHGYASEDGPDKFNEALAAERAALVRTVLLSEGVPAGSVANVLTHGEMPGDRQQRRAVVIDKRTAAPPASQPVAPGPPGPPELGAASGIPVNEIAFKYESDTLWSSRRAAGPVIWRVGIKIGVEASIKVRGDGAKLALNLKKKLIEMSGKIPTKLGDATIKYGDGKLSGNLSPWPDGWPMGEDAKINVTFELSVPLLEKLSKALSGSAGVLGNDRLDDLLVLSAPLKASSVDLLELVGVRGMVPDGLGAKAAGLDELAAMLAGTTAPGSVTGSPQLGLWPNPAWPGWAGLGVGAGMAAGALAFAGYGMYKIGEARDAGKLWGVRRSFAEGYADALAALTQGERLDDEEELRSIDVATTMPDVVAEYVRSRGRGAETTARKLGAAAVLQQVDQIRTDRPEEWQRLVAAHRARFGPAPKSRRAAYLQTLDPQAKGGGAIGIPLIP